MHDSKVGDVPSVTAEEMASVLEALRQNGNTIRNCESETLEGYYESGDRKEVKMLAEYQARTRSGRNNKQQFANKLKKQIKFRRN